MLIDVLVVGGGAGSMRLSSGNATCTSADF